MILNDEAVPELQRCMAHTEELYDLLHQPFPNPSPRDYSRGIYQQAMGGSRSAFVSVANLAALGNLNMVDLFLEELQTDDARRRRTAVKGLRYFNKGLKPFIGQMYCQSCIAAYQFRKVQYASGMVAEVPVCRRCGRREEVFMGIREVVIVVDDRAVDDVEVRNAKIIMGMTARGMAADFTTVDIGDACDRKVEIFCAGILNDMDEQRLESHRRARCVIKNCSRRNANTVRILRNLFYNLTTVGNRSSRDRE